MKLIALSYEKAWKVCLAQMATNLVTSAEPISLSYASIKLTFSNVELHQDHHALILRCNIENKGEHDEYISSHSFILSANDIEALPSVSYISDRHDQSTTWTWKSIKPNEPCTIIMKYLLNPNYTNYDLKFNFRRIKHVIKRFHRSNDNKIGSN